MLTRRASYLLCLLAQAILFTRPANSSEVVSQTDGDTPVAHVGALPDHLAKRSAGSHGRHQHAHRKTARHDKKDKAGATSPAVRTALTSAQVNSLAAATDKLSTSSSTPYIQFHNTVRAAHSAGAMTWSASLAKQALQHAQTCVFEHSARGNFGENIAYGSKGYYGAGDLMALWYNEVSVSPSIGSVSGLLTYSSQSYDFSNPGYSSSTGHFTQMVWKGSNVLGCGVADCSSAGLGIYLVCQYQPPGNYIGEFQNNVFP